jgi:folate-binding protein YgfZ
LAPGGSALAAALSAQGRVEGVFSVFCEADDRFIVVCDGGDPESLANILKRFLVADRVTVQDISAEVCVVHVATDESSTLQRIFAGSQASVCCIPRGRIANDGVDLIVNSQDREMIARVLTRELGQSISLERYNYLRWRAGCAVFPDEINDQGMLLEYGLRDAVSFAKGCYVGQEVVERSDAIGKVPRHLERIVLEGGDSVGVGSSISTAAGEALGKVVGEVHVANQGEAYLFALLRVGKYKGNDPVVCGDRRGVIVSREGGGNE